MSNNYLKEDLRVNLVGVVPRLLTQLDRDELSPTFGCFDRNYWQYKIRDFPSGVLQQSTYTLTLLYKNEFEGNYCFNNPNIIKYIKGSIDFWCLAQRKSGGFDEYWPNEDSYPPLVFSFFSVLASCRALELKSSVLENHFNKAYLRVLSHQETEATNQEAAGIAALYEYYLYIGKREIYADFDRRLKGLLARQNTEGWFPEHGGADIGYSSVTLYYLAHLYKLTGRSDIYDAVKDLIFFLKYFVAPDGSCGGYYGSRNTEYFLLGGLAVMEKDKDAYQMLSMLNKDLNKFDDRYLFHYIYQSYLYAFLALSPNRRIDCAPSGKQSDLVYLRNCGLYIRKWREYLFISNLKKGATFKLFKGKELIASNCGYRIKTGKKKYLVTSWICDNPSIKVAKDYLRIKTSFYKNKYFVPSVVTHILIRIIAVFLGNKLVTILKRNLIHQNNPGEGIFVRKIHFNTEGIKIDDYLHLVREQPIYRINEGALRVVPSSNFFSKTSLQYPSSQFIKSADKLKITTRIS